ncbi:hypothetical protein GOBAR_AA27854 [Gossypium barbadense]|uniref:Uncharacterized protein n=1 Tax=Gossypium barbadense TaxID=3634 RepID=A0A2P5WP14_GOSBA|nr:hypothetical protein GOBAR_AA27854 [Gossypium barbadense]
MSWIYFLVMKQLKVWCKKQEASVITLQYVHGIIHFYNQVLLPLALHTFRGHTNEKNFVGLIVNSDYIPCGSETNEVYVPVTWHRFGSMDMDDGNEDASSHIISAVCWKSDSLTLLSANSQGTIKVLVVAAW